MLIAKGANKRLATKVIDYRERSAADNQSRQARDRIVSATTGRATNSNINLNDPPPGRRCGGEARAAAVGRRRTRVASHRARSGRGAPGGPRPASDIERIGKQAASLRSTTPRVTDSPMPRWCCSRPA